MVSVYSNCHLFPRRFLALIAQLDVLLVTKLPVARSLYGVKEKLDLSREVERDPIMEGSTKAYQRWSDEKDSSAPLLDRGWVYQEQILPPRTIYFGAHGVRWECRIYFAG